VEASWSRSNAPLEKMSLVAASGAGLATFWATQHSMPLRCATGGVLAVCVALGYVPQALAVATLRTRRVLKEPRGVGGWGRRWWGRSGYKKRSLSVSGALSAFVVG
jgi:hypothetical protein